MGRDLLDDAVDNGGATLAALAVVAALCFVALVAVLALCAPKAAHKSSPSIEVENQPRSESIPVEKDVVPERQWSRPQEVADSVDRVRNLCVPRLPGTIHIHG